MLKKSLNILTGQFKKGKKTRVVRLALRVRGHIERLKSIAAAVMAFR